LEIKVQGLDEKLEKLRQFRQEYKNKIRSELIRHGTEMVRNARQGHRFTSRTGNADRSIDINVPIDETSLTFGIVQDYSKTDWNDVSYVTFQHEGTYDGYNQSRISNPYTPTTPKRAGAGIQADHFLERAWFANIEQLKEAIKNIVIEDIREII